MEAFNNNTPNLISVAQFEQELVQKTGYSMTDFKIDVQNIMYYKSDPIYLHNLLATLKDMNFETQKLTKEQVQVLVTSPRYLDETTIFNFTKLCQLIKNGFEGEKWDSDFIQEIFTVVKDDYNLNIVKLMKITCKYKTLFDEFDTKVIQKLIIGPKFDVARFCEIYNAIILSQNQFPFTDQKFVYNLLNENGVISTELISFLILEFNPVFNTDKMNDHFVSIYEESIGRLVGLLQNIQPNRIGQIYNEVCKIPSDSRCYLKANTFLYLITTRSPIVPGKLKDITEAILLMIWIICHRMILNI